MAKTLQKWGNGLGIRVPKRRRRPKHNLAELLAKVKGPNPHKELMNDPPRCREII
jgi:antitoxin component of MazEF toxin-antitoxin module